MRPSEAAALGAFAALVWFGAGPVAAEAPDIAGALAAARRQCIAAAVDTQGYERAAAATGHQIDLLGRDAAARRRDLDESRKEQAGLLEMLIYLGRNPPTPVAAAALGPLDRLHGESLMQAMLPTLRDEAQALTGEIARIASLRSEIAAKRHDLAAERDRLMDARVQLAQLVARRQELIGRSLPADSAVAIRIATLTRDAKTVDDLIPLADAATERRDKESLARTRAAAGKTKTGDVAPDGADPTKPAALRAFDPPQSQLAIPVSGTVSQPFGDGDGGPASRGLGLAAPSAAEVVAPFDGRVVYAGSFRNLGLVLIIRHGRLYHSLLGGLGRVDVAVDQWVVAGEPVGALPDAGPESGRSLYFELHRDGQPVDPQPWLAIAGEARSATERDGPRGDQGVRQ